MEATKLEGGLVLNMTYELVPPEEHQRNMAEKAIQTFKDHFVGVLSGCAKSMPMHPWCQLLPQVERQLLLLQQSRLNPGMLAYTHVYQGQHDYNKHPFVPIGMELLVHKKPHKQLTFAQHCKKGYILGTSFEHFRAQKVWMVDSHDVHTSGATWFKHKYLTNPSLTPEDQIIAAIGGLAKTLTTGVPPQLRDNTVDKLRQLQKILTPKTDVKGKENKATNQDTSPVPRVVANYAPPPRVPARVTLDATTWKLPESHITNKTDPTPPAAPITPQKARTPTPTISTTNLQRSQQIKDALEAARADIGNLWAPNQETPQRWKRIEEAIEKLRDKSKLVLACIILGRHEIGKGYGGATTLIEWPTKPNKVEIRSIEHKLVLACIKPMYSSLSAPYPQNHCPNGNPHLKCAMPS
jgi:hypothetical protein